MNEKESKTWIEISRENLIHNIEQFKGLIGPDVLFMAVVKSNAYGHGLLEVGKIAVENGADWLGVDSIDEALQLRGAGIDNNILVLGYTLKSRLEEAANNNISLTIYNKETIKELGRLNKKINIHIKIETGTSRQGIHINEIIDFVNQIKKYKNINIEGLSTHFANIEDTTDHSYAQNQLQKFNEAIDLHNKQKVEIPIKHSACSAAAILFPETYFDMVRVGISLYGYWSSKETYISAINNGKNNVDLKKNKLANFNLKPSLTWKTKVAQVKILNAGSYVSYGLTEKVNKETKIAILPIGYWDGYDRRLSSIGNVLINGKRCKVLGRICMNMFIVEVTHLNDIKIEDEVVLIGKQDEEEITVEEIAQKVSTINYEVVTRINPLIKRIVI